MLKIYEGLVFHDMLRKNPKLEFFQNIRKLIKLEALFRRFPETNCFIVIVLEIEFIIWTSQLSQEYNEPSILRLTL